MKRTPINRRTGLRRTGIRRRPPSAKAYARQFSADVRARVWARAGGRCEAAASHLCRGTIEHYHHRRLRSQGGSGDISNCLGVCSPCHSHIHRHPAASYAAGWMVRGS